MLIKSASRKVWKHIKTSLKHEDNIKNTLIMMALTENNINEKYTHLFQN